MMSKKSPQLRFDGFTDDWEELKLGDVLSERNDQTPETNEYPLMSFVQGKGVTPKGERYNRSFLVKDSEKKYKKTELGDFIYSSNNLETGSIGFNRTGKAVISPVYSIFESKKSRESQFIGIMSARKDFISKMVRFRQGVVYGQWRIHESDFLNIDMKMPNDKEQQLIISFFENIDKTIALHQRKLDLLKEQKKGYLQKMFPKNGEKVPELRFAGFADDWEERKLIDLATTYIGLVTTMTENYTNKGTLLIRNSDIKEGRFDLSNPIYLEEQFAEENKTRRMRKGDVVTVHTGDIGTSAMINSELDGAIGFATITTRPTKELDSNFLAWYFNSNYHKKYAKRMSTGDGRSNYNMKDFNKNVIPTPQIDEQQKIGAFFKQLDDTIALHQCKLDLLKEQKKGFLQKMFV
ncbi:restriction endonuclease subunit S [Lactococcus petauri]|uniref:restriction endonuclease subunit S n=1 Tax=Lactococcus petauri TaxID=1940789 RepID=UPI0024352E24|nr:restriction endonuclease subunit S [Lactococcus petauri]MDG6137498.1 restriction endonuclease subunit S [Lactococcus petauri]